MAGLAGSTEERNLYLCLYLETSMLSPIQATPEFLEPGPGLRCQSPMSPGPSLVGKLGAHGDTKGHLDGPAPKEAAWPWGCGECDALLSPSFCSSVSPSE